MMLFDDLRDNEWALVEGLFCSEPARRSGAAAPRGSPLGGERRAVGAVDGRRLVEAARPLSVAADLPPPLRRMAGRRHARRNREATRHERPADLPARAHRRECCEAARPAEPRPAARRLLDQSGILARARQDGVTNARSGGFGRPVSFRNSICSRRLRCRRLPLSWRDTSIYQYLQQACTPALTLATYQQAAWLEGSPAMKPMSLLVACGIVISLALSAPARADDRAKPPHRQQDHRNTLRQPPSANASGRQTVPRGDLRGDIASNARARIGSQPSDVPRHP